MTNYLILLGTGLFAGFMNVTAGGGSLIALPVLILTGMNPVTANGTNRIAVLIQNITASGNFYRHGRRDLREGLTLGLAAIPGAVAGAMTAMVLPDGTFRAILAGAILLGLTVALFYRKKKDGEGKVLKRKTLLAVLFLFIGFYGGLIQAGTGYLIIFALTMIGGLDLCSTNSMKVIIIAVYLIPSIAVFVSGGKLELVPGLVLAAGNAAGGFMGSTFSHKMGSGWIRGILAVALLAMSVKLVLS